MHRVGVCATDIHAFAGRQPYFDYPRVLGHELGVEILEAGESDRGLEVGDRCAVEPYLNCGECIACRRGRPNCCQELRVLGVHTDGGMCTFMAIPTNKLHASANLSFDQLALVETLSIGAHAVERAQLERGEKVLVIGVGPIGLGTIQFAQAEGAQVLVMDVKEERLEFCRSKLGVDRTLSPADGDVVTRLTDLAGGDLPTAVFDATGYAPSMMETFNLMAPGGRIVFVGLVQDDITFNDANFHRRETTLLATRNSTPETFTRIIERIEAGSIDTSPWITHRMQLAEVPESFPGLSEQPGLVKAVVEVEE